MKIIVINGRSESGKDTFVHFIQQKIGRRCLNISSIDFVKEIATECVWNGEKTPNNRKFLSDLKDLLTEWDDIPMKKIMCDIALFEIEMIEYYGLKSDDLFVFVHVREPQEIVRLKEKLNAYTLFITRPDHIIEPSNHADAEVDNYQYDYYINNCGTLDDLAESALDFIEKLKDQSI